MDYRNKVILAPMVRIGTLPTRLLALKYGADIVYTEEIIDRKILNTERIENKVLGTIDYVSSDSTLVFRTNSREKPLLVFQMIAALVEHMDLFEAVLDIKGTANSQTALKAAKKIEQDVSAIDINMGCPKEFSIKGGMGAALLKKPDTIKEILTTLVQNVAVPVTCKIRLLPEIEDSLRLVKMIEGTGVAAIAIHGRLTEERPRHPNRNETIKTLAQHLTIPVIANGGSLEILCYEDIAKFREATGSSSVMVARAAQWNTSIFRPKGILPVKEVVKEYLKLAINVDNDFPNTKYCILSLLHADMDQQEGLATQAAKSVEEICDIWGLADNLARAVESRKRNREQVDHCHGIKRRKTEDGTFLVEMPVRFIKKDYGIGESPKQRVHLWTQKQLNKKASYDTVERTEDRCYKSVLTLDCVKYTATYWEKSKQLAEQAAAIVALTVIGEHDGRNPATTSPNDEVLRAWREEFQMRDDVSAIYRHKKVLSGSDAAKNRLERAIEEDLDKSSSLNGGKCDVDASNEKLSLVSSL